MGPAADRVETAPIDRGTAVLGLLTVLLANARYLAGLSELLDPMVSMEPFYIRMARQPLVDILREPPAWGPLYALWLKPFVALFDDPFAVCAANLAALSIALTTLVYLHVLQRTRRAALAVAAALLFLIADVNVPLAGKVSDFALLVLLAGWSAAALVARGARRTTLAAGTALVAAYARPELYPAAGALWLVAAWQALREGRAHGGAVAAWPAAGLTLAIALALAVGTPLAGGDRLFDAFREHFAWNWGTWHQDWRYFQTVWEEQFGGAASVREAVRANPGAVTRHLASNLAGSVAFLVGGAFRHYPLLAPADSAAGVAIEAWLLAAAAYGTLTVVAVRPALRRQFLARHGDGLLWYAAVAVFCLAAATLVYPRPHYLAIPGALALIVGALAAALVAPEPLARSWPARLLAAAVCLAIVPRPFLLPSVYAVPGAPFTARVEVVRPVADTLAVVRALTLPPPVHVLTLTDGLGDLLGPGYEEVRMWQKGPQPLQAYLRDRHVDVIVAMQLQHDSFVVDDPLWRVIQTDPAAAGFTRVPVPGHDGVGVFVRAGAGS